MGRWFGTSGSRVVLMGSDPIVEAKPTLTEGSKQQREQEWRPGRKMDSRPTEASPESVVHSQCPGLGDYCLTEECQISSFRGRTLI